MWIYLRKNFELLPASMSLRIPFILVMVIQVTVSLGPAHAGTVPDIKPEIELNQALSQRKIDVAKVILNQKTIHPTVVNELLCKMASAGIAEGAKLLIEYGANIETACRPSETTPLMEAALWGKTDTVHLLLNAGAKVNAMHSDGKTALTRALDFERLGAAELLLQHGANPNVKTFVGRTPLKSAVIFRKQGVINLLLRYGADPDIADDSKITPLESAISNGQNDLIKLLLQHKADPNRVDRDGYTPLSKVIRMKDVELAKLLLNAGANPNLRYPPSGNPFLIEAISNNNAALIDTLLAYGVDPNTRSIQDNSSALMLASSNAAGTGIIEKLIKAGANINTVNRQGRNALILALTKGHYANARFLVEIRNRRECSRCARNDPIGDCDI